MNRLRKIIRPLIVTLLVLYIGTILILHLPFVQKGLGSWLAGYLSEIIGSEVRIGRIDPGVMNRLILDDVLVLDPHGNEVLSAARIAVTLNVTALLQGDLEITTAQMFKLHATLTRQTQEAPLNIQYIIDAFTSEDEEESSPLRLKISSLILRHVSVSYDVLSEQPQEEGLDLNHLHLDEVGLTASLKVLDEDSLNIAVRRLNFTETSSGLILSNLAFLMAAGPDKALIDGFELRTPNSHLHLDSLQVSYKDYSSDGKFALSVNISPSSLLPTDFAPLLPSLQHLTSPMNLEGRVTADNRHIHLRSFQLHSDDESLQLRAEAQLTQRSEYGPDMDLNIQRLALSPEGLTQVLNMAAIDGSTLSALTKLGTIEAQGTVAKHELLYTSQLTINTDLGHVVLDGDYFNNAQRMLSAHIQSDKLDVGVLSGVDDLATASFSLDVDADLQDYEHPKGHLLGEVYAIDYKGYTYNNIYLDGTLAADGYNGLLTVDDEHLKLNFNGSLSYPTDGEFAADMSLAVTRFEPYDLLLTRQYKDEDFSFVADANVHFRNLTAIWGDVSLDSIRVKTPEENLRAAAITFHSQQLEGGENNLIVSSDFLNATFTGNVNYIDILPSFQNQLSQHLPSLIERPAQKPHPDTAFDFYAEMAESPLLHHFIDVDFHLLKPAHLSGRLNAEQQSFLQAILPRVEYDGTEYADVRLTLDGTDFSMKADGHLCRILPEGTTQVHVNALAQHDVLTTHLDWDQNQEMHSAGFVSARTLFSKEQGELHTLVHLQPSQLTFNETTWLVKPTDILIQPKSVECSGLEISHLDRFVKVSGRMSEHPSDSLQISLNNVEVDYVLSLVDFSAVDFRGRAFGTAYISNVYTKPHFNAMLRVEDLAIGQGGVLGVGDIRAHWDEAVNGVSVNGHIVDTDSLGQDRITNCSGYISPADNLINLNITAQNTNAYFINDFLGNIFDDIHGNVNGVLNVVGPLNDINLVGDMSADVCMTLRATHVNYHISPLDTLRFRPQRFLFEDVRISDDEGHQGVINGYVSHRNVKNFAYEFRIAMQQLMAYDEAVFNSDKFMGRVYADGTLQLQGADGRPLIISADVHPARGSFFAYDAATPDAITSSAFITFRNAQTVAAVSSSSEATGDVAALEQNPYHGDIIFNASIHLNPDCSIRLRMDNTDDGYINTYGTGLLQAFYHNKGSFTLDGTYNIQGGRYKLYLQDIIYRELELQPGSNVVFNGNPFDANIHLICHHTIQSVPLSDLTSTTSNLGSDKVKVVCILDINGQLDNMNFKFNYDLPNVNDETRQLVRSYITTEEDMNQQIIYLLGLGRFYTNEYARSTGQAVGTGAMNTLLSSTISGQVNQMLQSAIGPSSKWNFGTGLTTGEQGWNDLDVEGLLSGRLLDDRLLINGNFGYRDNAMTQNPTFIGDFDLKWRIRPRGNTYLKAYNKTNDRYFTKSTINTQGIGISYQRDFEHWSDFFRSH